MVASYPVRYSDDPEAWWARHEFVMRQARNSLRRARKARAQHNVEMVSGVAITTVAALGIPMILLGRVDAVVQLAALVGLGSACAMFLARQGQQN